MKLLTILLQTPPCPPRNPHCVPLMSLPDWEIPLMLSLAIIIAIIYLKKKQDENN